MPDKSFDTLVPQDTDSRFDLQGRGAKALGDAWQLLSGGLSVNASGVNVSTLTPLGVNASRKRWEIQNTGTNVLTVAIGAAQIDLKPGSANNKGEGAKIEDTIWRGAVSVSGTSPRYNFTEWQ